MDQTSIASAIQSKIYTIRGVKVMLDRDLAELYHVTTGNLNKAVKRNRERFPEDFMFQLTKEELKQWVFQFGISNSEKMGLRQSPYAFTEQGIAMLSGILKSKIAVEINIRIMRAFVELRQAIASQPEYALLKETVHRIESKIEAIESNNLVEQLVIHGNITQLSEDVRRISETLDQFQNEHIILIKRPEEGLGEG
jgi:hypothetical protein